MIPNDIDRRILITVDITLPLKGKLLQFSDHIMRHVVLEKFDHFKFELSQG